jgi:hypothetical protein
LDAQEFGLLDLPGRAEEWAVHEKRLVVGTCVDQLDQQAYHHIFQIRASPSSVNDDRIQNATEPQQTHTWNGDPYALPWVWKKV